MSGLKLFLLLLLGVLGCIGCFVIGVMIYQKQQENSRKRFYWPFSESFHTKVINWSRIAWTVKFHYTCGKTLPTVRVKTGHRLMGFSEQQIDFKSVSFAKREIFREAVAGWLCCYAVLRGVNAEKMVIDTTSKFAPHALSAQHVCKAGSLCVCVCVSLRMCALVCRQSRQAFLRKRAAPNSTWHYFIFLWCTITSVAPWTPCKRAFSNWVKSKMYEGAIAWSECVRCLNPELDGFHHVSQVQSHFVSLLLVSGYGKEENIPVNNPSHSSLCLIPRIKKFELHPSIHHLDGTPGPQFYRLYCLHKMLKSTNPLTNDFTV